MSPQKTPETSPGRHLQEKLRSLPDGPGVYLMKDVEARVIYVGKAKSLRSRVRSYFAEAVGDTRATVRFLVKRVADVEWIVTATEKDALILENTLIKRHHPRYNVKLRDAKTYIGLRLNVQDPFPRLTTTRRMREDGSLYFGPYTSSQSMRETVYLIHKIFPLRSCSDPVFRQYRRAGRPCIEFQMKRCLAPCCDYVDKPRYDELVRGVALFLRGQSRELLRDLERQMKAAAEGEAYERAADLRDRIGAVEATIERQRMVSEKEIDRDIFGFAREENQAEVQVLFVRQGKLIGGLNYPLRGVHLDDAELLSSFLSQYYARDRVVPAEVLLPMPLEGQGAVGELLTERVGRRVRVTAPRRGEPAALVRMAGENARAALDKRLASREAIELALDELRDRLRLRGRPDRIECYDISNLQGKMAVGSCVAFHEGRPDVSRYKKFRIKGLDSPDDYRMMKEVLARRFRRAGGDGDLPDLILLDGGRGQLNIALEVLRELQIDGVGVATVAKYAPDAEVGARAKARTSEKVYIPDLKEPVGFPANSPAMFLLQRLRDESHRFAIAYHKLLRRRLTLLSALEDIPGIGKGRRRLLLRRFGSLRRVRDASATELCEVPGITPTTARAIQDRLREPTAAPEGRSETETSGQDGALPGNEWEGENG
ncbi:MAG: excinuclease ABC subunit UvrC [Deltaproteobacteria bacterium]|nr:excinuclease ABC subunit UvrC [Deltaproteobacteria bacterium]